MTPKECKQLAEVDSPIVAVTTETTATPTRFSASAAA